MVVSEESVTEIRKDKDQFGPRRIGVVENFFLKFPMLVDRNLTTQDVCFWT